MKIKIECGDCHKTLKQDGGYTDCSETRLIIFVKPHYCKGAMMKTNGKKSEGRTNE